jgi:hypothetical protein
MNFVAIRTAIFSDLTMEFSRLRTTAKKGKRRGEDKPPALSLTETRTRVTTFEIANPVSNTGSVAAAKRITNSRAGQVHFS